MAMTEDKLRDFVRLYRLCGKPSISEESFSYKTENAERNIVQALHDFLVHSEGDITHLISGEDQISVPFLMADHANKPLSFNCHVPSQGFHKTFEMFVKDTPSLHKGSIPSVFYIGEKDYFHGQSDVPPEIQKIGRTCRLIAFLGKVITHLEEKAKHIRFVLLTHDKDTHSARKQIFETCFQYSDVTNISELEQLEQIVDEQDLHRNERFAIFRNTLAEFLEKEPDSKKRFIFILKHFDQLIEQFDLNYETYINRFAFEKFEMEVVSKSDELLKKLNTTLNDIVTKVLVVPAGVLALKALGGDNDISTSLMVLFAIVAISVVLTLLVRHQFSTLKQIGKNIDFVFSKFNKGEGGAIKIARENKDLLVKKKNSINKYLWVFIVIVWMPFLLCFVFLLKEFSFEAIWGEFASWFTILITRCCDCFQSDSTITDPNIVS